MARYVRSRLERGHRHYFVWPDDLPFPIESENDAVSGVPHTHDEYAGGDHVHDTSHSHTAGEVGASAGNHTHDFAASGHSHDTSHGHSAADVGAATDDHSHDTTHDHDADYAHDHPYAATEHDHDYADPDHSHDTSGLASAGHTHQEAAHDHDADYSGTAHTHDTTHSHTAADVGASATAHTHDTSHNHDASYAPTHAHPYAAIAHSHVLADGDIPAAIARDSEVTSALQAHEATPHGGSAAPVYTVVAGTALDLAANTVVSISPTNNTTYTTTVPAAGHSRRVIVRQTTATSRTLTFGSGFKPTTTLATGTTTARVFVLTFVSDGTNLYEASRTAAMPA